MKTIKTQTIDDSLFVQAKFSEKKGNANVIVVKIYLRTTNNLKKIWIPDSAICCLSRVMNNEEKKEFCKEWRWNFFLDNSKGTFEPSSSRYMNEDKYLCNIGRGWHNLMIHYGEGESWFNNGQGFELANVRTDRDYFQIEISREEFENHSISFRLVRNLDKQHQTGNYDTPTEEIRLFTIDCPSASVTGQHKANIAGFNDDVQSYLQIFRGLYFYPDFETVEEFKEWYNSLTQVVADKIRNRAKHYFDTIYGWKNSDASIKQMEFIRKNGPEYFIKYGEKLASPLASAIIEQISEKIPASDAQKNFIKKLDATIDTSNLSKAQASEMIENLLMR